MALAPNREIDPPLHRLASNQRDIWFDQLAWPDSPLYNIGGYLKIEGGVRHALLSKALGRLINESQALRLRFVEREGQVLQYLVDSQEMQLPEYDYSQHTNPEADAIAWMEQRFATVLKIADGEMWEFALLRISSQRHLLMTRFHQLQMDSWSLSLINERLAVIYNALHKGEPIPPRQAPNYMRHVAEEQRYCESEQYQLDGEYWQGVLPQLPPVPFEAHPQRTVAATLKASLVQQLLPKSLHQRMLAFAREQHCSVVHLLLCALAIHTHRTTGVQQVIIGVPTLNRGGARYTATLGMFAGLSPLLLELHPTQPVEELLVQCRDALRELTQYQRYPIGALNRRLELLQKGRSTAFDLVLAHDRHEYNANYANSTVTAHRLFSGEARYSLMLTLCEYSAQRDLELVLAGRERLFSSDRLGRLGESLRLLLEEQVERPGASVANLELLGPGDRSLLRHFNSSLSHTPQSSLQQLLQDAARAHSESIALSWPSGSLSYLELDHWSRRIARRLQLSGVGPGALVAIAMHRSPELVASLLAVIHVGVAWMPLDPDAPRGRILNLLSQSKASLLLSRSEEGGRLVEVHPKVLLVDDPVTLRGVEASSDMAPFNPHHMAYLLFSSKGGLSPKGVLVSQGALLRRLAWLGSQLAITTSDRFVAQMPFSFDPALIELLLPLLHGATLVLPPAGRLDPYLAGQFALRERITLMVFVPSTLRGYVEAAEEAGRGTLRLACCGGEPLPASLANRFLAINQARLLNLYGPVEGVLFASCWECQPRPLDQPLPIGRPCDDVTIHLLDEHHQPLPVGEVGEICIGGEGLATAYLGDEGLTTRRFIPDPFSPEPQARLFRSGDMGYLGEDGQLYLSGQVERRLFIDGHRVEPELIEALLDAQPEVKAAAVRGQVEVGLHAYVVIDASQEAGWHGRLTSAMRAALPTYMQPCTLQRVADLPLDWQTGKLDHAALPMAQSPPIEGERVASSALEQQLLECWERLLPAYLSITLEENFFASGGDSLAAIALLGEIEVLTGQRLSLDMLLEHPTIAQQAALITHLVPQAQRTSAEPVASSTPAARRRLYLCTTGRADAARITVLIEALGPDTEVKLLHPPAQASFATLEQLAQIYLEQVAAQPAGRTFVAGLSLAGLAALELARLLTAQGRPPDGLLLFDTYYPRWPLNGSWLMRLIGWTPGLNRLRFCGRRPGELLHDGLVKRQLDQQSQFNPAPYNGAAVLLQSQDFAPLQRFLYRPWCRVLVGELYHEPLAQRSEQLFALQNLPQLVQLLDRVLQRMERG